MLSAARRPSLRSHPPSLCLALSSLQRQLGCCRARWFVWPRANHSAYTYASLCPPFVLKRPPPPSHRAPPHLLDHAPEHVGRRRDEVGRGVGGTGARQVELMRRSVRLAHAPEVPLAQRGLHILAHVHVLGVRQFSHVESDEFSPAEEPKRQFSGCEFVTLLIRTGNSSLVSGGAASAPGLHQQPPAGSERLTDRTNNIMLLQQLAIPQALLMLLVLRRCHGQLGRQLLGRSEPRFPMSLSSPLGGVHARSSRRRVVRQPHVPALATQPTSATPTPHAFSRTAWSVSVTHRLVSRAAAALR